MGFPPLSVLQLFSPEQGNFCRFSSEIFFCFYFVPFSRASLPPFEWGQVSQNLGFCSFPLRVFLPPKWGSLHFPFWRYSPPNRATSVDSLKKRHIEIYIKISYRMTKT